MTRRESSNVGSENNGMERALKWAGRKSLQGLCFLLQVDFQFSELNAFQDQEQLLGARLVVCMKSRALPPFFSVVAPGGSCS